MAALSFCLEYLHRHPDEVDLSIDCLLDLMAYDKMKNEKAK